MAQFAIRSSSAGLTPDSACPNPGTIHSSFGWLAAAKICSAWSAGKYLSRSP
ncbi:MAG: hypothetical protein ACLQFR_17540 [Streptosporangiaceae bacterium]